MKFLHSLTSEFLFMYQAWCFSYSSDYKIAAGLTEPAKVCLHLRAPKSSENHLGGNFFLDPARTQVLKSVSIGCCNKDYSDFECQQPVNKVDRQKLTWLTYDFDTVRPV